MNPNDEIRNSILQYFYDRNASATSRFGKKGSAIRISDVKRELKESRGLTQQQVMSNLTYLIDRGWVKTVNQEKTVTVSRGTIPSVVVFYEIAAPGIEKIEGESEFKPRDRYEGINITATGASVVTLGDGNVVNVQYQELHQQLDALKTAVSGTESFTDEQKLDIAVDIESIKDQLAKAKPNKSIIGTLWKSIEASATVATVVDYVHRAAPYIARLLTG